MQIKNIRKNRTKHIKNIKKNNQKKNKILKIYLTIRFPIMLSCPRPAA